MYINYCVTLITMWYILVKTLVLFYINILESPFVNLPFAQCQVSLVILSVHAHSLVRDWSRDGMAM